MLDEAPVVSITSQNNLVIKYCSSEQKMYCDLSQSNQDYSQPESNPEISRSQCSPSKNDSEDNFQNVIRQSDSSVHSRNILPPSYGSSIEESDNVSEPGQIQMKPGLSYQTNFSHLQNPGQLNFHDISIYLNQNPTRNNVHGFEQIPVAEKQQIDQGGERTNRLFSNQKKQSRKSEASKDKGKGTKNIIKNFGRNTITFVEASKYLFSDEFKKMGKNYLEYLPKLKRIRESINTISDMRNLWIDQEHGKLMRRVSEHYFRKQALFYVFNSHVKPDAYADHIQCRRKLRQALRDPENFHNLK